VLPNLSVFNIVLVPTLKDEIIAAKMTSEGMDDIKCRMKEGDPEVTCFHEGVEGTL
jgi:hypothetical protein